MGGSGGRIILESEANIDRQISAIGGLSENTSCANGGAGTIYFVQNRSKLTRRTILISQNSSNQLILTPTYARTKSFSHENLRLEIEAGAILTPYTDSTDRGVIEIQSVDVNNA